jgi:glutathione S-transferase
MNSTFWPGFRPLFWNLVRTPPDRRDAQATEASRARSAEMLGHLDAHLSNRT